MELKVFIISVWIATFFQLKCFANQFINHIDLNPNQHDDNQFKVDANNYHQPYPFSYPASNEERLFETPPGKKLFCS